MRLSTAIAYLLPARDRPNLTIRPHCLVNRVLFTGDRAVGVEFDVADERYEVRGRRVTLAAGAIGSPAILLRSGIGAGSALAELGIEPVADLPGVGAGLTDHPVARLLLVPKPGSCNPQTPLAQIVLRYTAAGSGEFNDMQQVVFSHVDVAGLGGPEAVAAVGAPLAIGLPVALERPHARGRLLLASPDPRAQPLIQLNFADNPEDLRRLGAGVRLAWQIAHEPEITRHTDHVAMLPEETISSDDALVAYVRATVATQFHPCGTARMGPPGDAMAVVDQYCRLRAIRNLRVVDASVMPAIPRANINLTCIMIGDACPTGCAPSNQRGVGFGQPRRTKGHCCHGGFPGVADAGVFELVPAAAARTSRGGYKRWKTTSVRNRYDAGSEGPASSERPSGSGPSPSSRPPRSVPDGGRFRIRGDELADR